MTVPLWLVKVTLFFSLILFRSILQSFAHCPLPAHSTAYPPRPRPAAHTLRRLCTLHSPKPNPSFNHNTHAPPRPEKTFASFLSHAPRASRLLYSYNHTLNYSPNSTARPLFHSRRSLTPSPTTKPISQGYQLPPSLCPSKISRPTVRVRQASRRCEIFLPFFLHPFSPRRRSSADVCVTLQRRPRVLPPQHPTSPRPKSAAISLRPPANQQRHRPLRRSRRGHRRSQTDSELHPYTHSAYVFFFFLPLDSTGTPLFAVPRPLTHGRVVRGRKTASVSPPNDSSLTCLQSVMVARL